MSHPHAWALGLACAACAPSDADRATADTSDAIAPVDVTTDVAMGDDHFFRTPRPWTRPVAGVEPSAGSQAIIADLAAGGWGNHGVFQIDFSIEVLDADASVPARAFTPTEDWFAGDCDDLPVPLPAGGALEGEDGYACAHDGDCHLIVHAPDALYEMWRANITDEFYGGCLAVWDLARDYGPDGRGLGCTSADAAGLPIAPLLFGPDEVAAGVIPHAIRFILPNARIRHRAYVTPATHATNPTAGGPDAPPYGIRLRLRADYPIAALPSEGARVVARALQTYGMFLADAGEIALTARSDRTTRARWDGLLDPHDLAALAVGDFEVVELGAAREWDGDCVRE